MLDVRIIPYEMMEISFRGKPIMELTFDQAEDLAFKIQMEIQMANKEKEMVE